MPTISVEVPYIPLVEALLETEGKFDSKQERAVRIIKLIGPITVELEKQEQGPVDIGFFI
jgi:hypothetical protein